MVAIHSTVRGPSLGGCRMWWYDDVRRATLDVLRLSRAMTYKAACANLPMGGGKGVIALPGGHERVPLTGRQRRDALLDFGDAVETLGGGYLTAEDVGIGSRDMPIIAQCTSHVTGLATARGGSGDPSPFTAIGVEAAIRTVCERLFGSPSLEGRTVAVLGLGHVGSRVARLCARAGAQLIVTDVDPGKRALAEQLGARWTTPGRALTAKVDVLSPCALGAVFDADTVPKLRCRAIAGAANNQLATERAAELLTARNILWAPDFVVNAGGIVNIAVELRPEGYDAAIARRDCRAIGNTLSQVFDAADAERVTPLAAANALAERRLRGAG
jgi:leucine dehydrogenase